MRSSEEQTAYLHIGGNDAYKIWIGENLVAQRAIDGHAQVSEQIIQVQIPRGTTRVLVKVDQAGGFGWGVFASLYSAAAQRQYIESFQTNQSADSRDCGWN